MVSDLCDENVHLSDMYEEIRRSPLAAEMKEEYESTIQSLEDEIASLKGNYDKLYEDHLLLKEDYESLQYMHRVLVESGVIARLEEMGVQEGDTVSILNFEFDYVK